VLVAPDSFGGTLSPREAAGAIATGWSRGRPDDEVALQPLSDGGDGLLDAVDPRAGQLHHVEVSGPRGHPIDAVFALDGGRAVIESARACGLALLAQDQRDPLMTTTWGVGQLLRAARDAGASEMLVGLGGSATVDGGAGAVGALGFRALVAGGSGLKVGGWDLPRVTAIEPGWADDWSDVHVTLLADVTTPLSDAAAIYGPQKGADAPAVEHLARGLAAWADVAERSFNRPGLRDEPGTGAAGGLAFGLAAAIEARIVRGAAIVADLVGLDEQLAGADLVITGEGRLDATSAAGKVVGEVVARARAGGIRVAAVCGQVLEHPEGLEDVEAASPRGPGPDPAESVATAAQRLAGRI